jgi:ABC-type molybdate transport system substrate-binding protein
MLLFTRWIAAAAVVVAGLPLPIASAQDASLLVFAAASMKNALDDVGAAFTEQSGVKVVASYDASSVLMRQIEGGAPADVFLSADLKWMDYGSQKKLIKDDTRVNLLGNKPVLIAPKDSKIDKVTIGPGFDLAKLAGDGRVATGDVRAVPVGIRSGRATKTRRLGRGRAEDGNDRKRSRGARSGRTRRGVAWYRLLNRCTGRARRESHWRVPGGLARSDHLCGRSDRHDH